MKRRLSLKSEHLTELTPNDLSAIAGGIQELPTRRCFTPAYPTLHHPCPTLDGACIAIEYTPLCPVETTTG